MDKPATLYIPRLRVGLILTVEAEQDLLPGWLKRNPELEGFFSFSKLGDSDPEKMTCMGYGGGSQDFDNPQPIIRMWTATWRPHMDRYREKVIPVLYSFLTSMDSDEAYYRGYRYLFIEIGLTRNSVYVRGDFHDNPSNFCLKTAIWPFESTLR